MYTWFQNLNDNPRHPRLFHFRGSIGSAFDKEWFKYEFASGPAFRFTVEPKRKSTYFIFGLGFFTLYLTVYCRLIPFLEKHRVYGFYVAFSELWIMIGKNQDEWRSSDPWYKQIVIKPKDIVLGRMIHFKDEHTRSYSPRWFKFRGEVYCIDQFTIETRTWIRSRIPYALHKNISKGVALDIKKPPMHRGKGTTSYNCEDDGIFGCTIPLEGTEKINLGNQEKIFEYAAKEYCKLCMRDIKRYGEANKSGYGIENMGFEYIGYDRERHYKHQIELSEREIKNYKRNLEEVNQEQAGSAQ